MEEEKETEDIELIKQKVQTHFEKNFLLHCSFKNGMWKNGKILEVSADFFILDEMFDGEMAVFFKELREVSTYNKFGGRKK